MDADGRMAGTSTRIELAPFSMCYRSPGGLHMALPSQRTKGSFWDRAVSDRTSEIGARSGPRSHRDADSSASPSPNHIGKALPNASPRHGRPTELRLAVAPGGFQLRIALQAFCPAAHPPRHFARWRLAVKIGRPSG